MKYLPPSQYVLDRALPENIRENFTNFTGFMEAYFEFMEQTGGVSDVLSDLTRVRDLDDTDQVEKFYDYITNELLPTIPNTMLAKPSLVAKFIRSSFYAAKGTEKSYRFLFHILYGKDISFYYPTRDILRTSSGNWVVKRSITVTRGNLNLLDLYNQKITGQTSGATAIVEDVVLANASAPVAELYLSHVVGTFLNAENITTTITVPEQYALPVNTAELVNEFVQTTPLVIVEKADSCYTSVIIDTGGAGYVKGEPFVIRDQPGGNKIGFGRITKITSGPIGNPTIVHSGQGYHGENRQVSLFMNLPITYEPGGNDVQNMPFPTFLTYLRSISPSSYYVTDADSTLDVRYDFTYSATVPDMPDTLIVNDTLGSQGHGAQLVISLVDDNGGIIGVSVIQRGDLYENPTVEIISTTGSGALITLPPGGAVAAAILYSFVSMRVYPNAVPDFTEANNSGQTATGHLSGGSVLCTYPGYYADETGFPSGPNKLQDNNFYQDFSYQIGVSEGVVQWQKTVTEAVHPAGYKLFCKYIQTDTNMLTLTGTGSYQIITAFNLMAGSMTLAENPVKITSGFNLHGASLALSTNQIWIGPGGPDLLILF